jgi:hypothetical protein
MAPTGSTRRRKAKMTALLECNKRAWRRPNVRDVYANRSRGTPTVGIVTNSLRETTPTKRSRPWFQPVPKAFGAKQPAPPEGGNRGPGRRLRRATSTVCL